MGDFVIISLSLYLSVGVIFWIIKVKSILAVITSKGGNSAKKYEALRIELDKLRDEMGDMLDEFDHDVPSIIIFIILNAVLAIGVCFVLVTQLIRYSLIWPWLLIKSLRAKRK